MSKTAATEGFPFGDSTLVFKVADKVFALLSLDANPTYINLKCKPEYAIELREQHEAIKPGYHMNKQHWNSVYVDGSLNHELIHELIDHSYSLIVASLPKSKKEKLSQL